MELQCFKTKWGFEGSFEAFAEAATYEGYDGLEGPVPLDLKSQQEIRDVLAGSGLSLIAEICTGGSYVPDSHATVADHVEDFQRKLDAALAVSPRQVNSMAGCDAWSMSQAMDFFGQVIERSQGCGVMVTFETHRARTLFNPWITRDLVLALPELYLTCDFSHWCVVAERLMGTESEAMEVVYPRARHIHGRVGYEQGPQVPHPGAPEYAYALSAHQGWWQHCWERMLEAGMKVTTLTPEFGPGGYLHHMPFTDMPVGDLTQINQWMMETERAHYAAWKTSMC
jgi:sugar phosphate isomerase/epimerase